MVGSGPFSEARQKKAAKSLILDETESGSQQDLLSAAAAVTEPEPAPVFDAAARRLLFQLSPTGHTLVSAVPKRTPDKQDIFVELEKLTISSGGKEQAQTKKRTLASTPPRSVRLAGPAARVAPSSLLAEEDPEDLRHEEVSQTKSILFVYLFILFKDAAKARAHCFYSPASCKYSVEKDGSEQKWLLPAFWWRCNACSRSCSSFTSFEANKWSQKEHFRGRCGYVGKGHRTTMAQVDRCREDCRNRFHSK